MSQAKELTSANFEQEVMQAQEPVLVDFWAPWCGPCRMMAPVIDAIAAKFSGRLKVAKVNVDESGDLAAQFEIRSIPTLIMFKNGQAVDRLIGAVPESELTERLERFLA